MSLRVGRDESATVSKSEDDWEVVAADRWRTSFRTLPMSYPTKPDPTTKKWHRLCHRSFLFYNPHGKRASDSTSHQEESFNEAEEPGFRLNVDLPGVQAALDSVAVYEEAVGFHYEQFPRLGLNLFNPIDLTMIVDEKELQVNKKRWDEMLEELMNGPAFDSDESLESSFVGSISSGDLHRSMSTVSSVDFTFSEGSIDSAGMPSTPRPKSSLNDVQIKETSPRSMDFRLQPLSPTRALNAAALSFVPASASLDEYSARSPSPSPSSNSKRTPSSEFSFNTFTFPTLNSHTPAALKVRKDDWEPQFNSLSAPTNDLLPPFFQDAPQRTRTRKSRTREIVDRLRSQIHPGDNSSSQDIMSSLSISERGGERSSSPPALNEDDDGWIDSSASSLISPSKSKRARELLLALARRRTDSLTSEAVKELMEAHSSPDSMDSREISFSPSPSPSPPLVTPMDDGWKECDAVPVTEPVKKTKRPSMSNPKDSSQTSTLNKKKGTVNTSTRTLASSSAHPHVHRTTQAHHPVQPQHYSSQASYLPISHPPSAAYPMVAPSQTHVPYFFPQYPAVAMSVPYGTYLQPPYPMGVGMGIPMHSGSAPLVNPVMAPNVVQYAPMPAPQLVPVPLQAVSRLGTVPTKGVQATSPNISMHSPSTTTTSYRQPPKHAAPLW